MKTDVNDEMLKKISYVNISSYRAKTVKSLQGDVKIPTKIAKDTGILPNHMSKVLKELKDAGIAECINEEARKGRLYRLTPKGEEIGIMIKIYPIPNFFFAFSLSVIFHSNFFSRVFCFNSFKFLAVISLVLLFCLYVYLHL